MKTHVKEVVADFTTKFIECTNNKISYVTEI